MVVVLVLAAIIGPLYYSLAQVKAANGGTITYLAAYLNTFLLFNLCNLFDAVVLDYLLLTMLKPRFLLLPGTEDLTYLFDDWRMHVGNFLKGIVFSTVASVPLALLAWL